MTLQEWEQQKDRELDQKLSALFQSAQSPAPRPGFVSRTMKAVRQAPLPDPELPLAGHQPVPQHRLVHPQPEVLDEVFRLGDQNLLDQVRPTEQKQAFARQSQRDDVAASSRAVREEPEPICAELDQVSVEPVTFRTGGLAHSTTLSKTR